MAIVRWSPSGDLASLHSAMDRLFGDMFGGQVGRAVSAEDRTTDGGPLRLPTYHLPVNITQTDSGYRIEAPVPGFRPEDVEVTFEDGVLTINARRQEEQQRQEGNYLRREVAFGNYWRQIALPGDVQAEGIKASFDNGVLTVEVPRAPRPQPKKIEVKAGEQQQQAAGARSASGSGSKRS